MVEVLVVLGRELDMFSALLSGACTGVARACACPWSFLQPMSIINWVFCSSLSGTPTTSCSEHAASVAIVGEDLLHRLDVVDVDAVEVVGVVVVVRVEEDDNVERCRDEGG